MELKGKMFMLRPVQKNEDNLILKGVTIGLSVVWLPSVKDIQKGVDYEEYSQEF